ncbi:MAG: glutathione peroxidase [Chitinophagales bacterium]
MKTKKKYRKLLRFLIVVTIAVITFWGYVEIVNLNSGHMTVRQKFLKAVYPVFTGFNKLFGKDSKILSNIKNVQPIESFYGLSVKLNNGKELSFDELKGKKVLLVNTASNCGFTAQYDDLEKLYEQDKDKLTIIGFPANDFREQEKGSDADIAQFCKSNFGITFPLATKASVIKGTDQQLVFQWLTDKTKNGWNNKQPSWNFSKYLINEQGVLTNYFDPAISPLSNEVQKAIDQ